MMKKRVLSFILCMVMVLTLFPGTALADSLPTMTVNLSGDILSWDAVDGAVKYGFTVSTGGGFTTATSVNLKTQCATYSAKSGSTPYSVYAIDANDRRITEVASGTYVYEALGTLGTPTNFQWNDFAVSWDAVEHADFYTVTLYRKDSPSDRAQKVHSYVGITNNSIDFTKVWLTTDIGPYVAPVPGAYYQVSVRAYSRAGYASSADGTNDFEQLVPGTVGDVQNITISGNILSWDAYPGAQRYHILYGNGGCSTTGTSVNLKEEMGEQGMANGSYTVKIEALDTNDGARGAQAISSLTVGPDYNYTGNGPLADPANLTWDGFTARWDAVEHADSYKVTVRRKSDDMVFVDTVTNINQYKVGGEPILGESYQFTVTAQSGHGYSRSATVTSAWKFIPMKYAVQLNACENGRISVENTMAEEGELVTVTAKPDEGYYFVEMSVDGSPVVGNSFVMPAKAVEVSAVFEPYTEINAVECTVIEPADGEMPSKAITVPPGAHYTAVVTSISHNGAEYLEPFVGGDYYYYAVEFIADPGYGFIDELPISINGRYLGTYGGSVTERNASYQFRAEYAPLAGVISVVPGTPRFGSTLTASWSGSEDVQFSWYLNGDRISGNSTSVSITYDQYIGKTLEVAATALGFSGEVRKVLGVVGKADAPAAPSLTYTKPSAAGASDAAIDTTSEMEWSTDRLVWTRCSGALTGLTAGTYYVRYASTEDTMAGAHAAVSIPDGNGLIKAAQAYVEQPVVGEVTSETVTAGDSTYTVTSGTVNDNPGAQWNGYLGANKRFSNITFEAADGFQFDEDTVFTLNGETITMNNIYTDIANGYVTLDKIKKPLTGTVNVSGTGEYGTYLTADFSGNNVNDPVYTWYVDGVETSYSGSYYSSFNVRAEYIGHEITVRVSNPARDGYIESAPILGRKAAGDTEDLEITVYQKPSAYGAADGEFFFGNFYWGGYEYSTDGASWTNVPDGDSWLRDMPAGTYYFRKAADEHYEAGKITVVIMPEADKLISMASCTIVEPVDGGTPALTVTVPGGANYTVTVEACSDTKNYDPVSVFAAPNYYEYDLRFVAAPGYKFQYSGANKTTVKINGKIVSASGGASNGSDLSVRPVFTCAYTPLVGTLEIDGFPFYEETMTAKLTDSNAGGTLTYIWYVDGERKDFGVDQDSFVINYREYVGCELSVTVQDSEHSGMLVSPGVMITDPGKTKLPKPTAAFSAETMLLTDVTSGMQYKIGMGAWTDISAASVDLSGVITGACTLSVKRAGDGITVIDSDAQAISITKPAAPMLGHTDCTTAAQNDGTITGVDTTMEYRAAGVPGWTKIASTSITGLTPGTYQVRAAANGTALPSDPTELAVEAYNPGVTVSGQVKSYNPNRVTTVELKQGGSVMYSTTIAATSGSGQVTQGFAIDSVTAGTYDLVVTKAGHLTYTVTGVVVGSSDVDLTANAKAEVKLITLLCGDINGDGWINFTDLQILRNVSNYGKQTVEPGVNELADLTGDGWVNFTDLQLLRNVSNYGKSNVSVSYGS